MLYLRKGDSDGKFSGVWPQNSGDLGGQIGGLDKDLWDGSGNGELQLVDKDGDLGPGDAGGETCIRELSRLVSLWG